MKSSVPTPSDVPYRTYQKKGTSDFAHEDMLRILRKITFWLDNAFQVPFTNYRVGLDSILGLVPGVGDAIGALFSAYIIGQAFKYGLPIPVITKMFYNVALDTILGSIPVLGDIFDAAWKANVMNLELLETHLKKLQDDDNTIVMKP